ncbi:hypothetical protein RVBP16_1590 [Pseudomonas phage sp. 30-2]|nr:hypothetical protein RVBP16_1590 [Pseudomonas phage sp. 30-2]
MLDNYELLAKQELESMYKNVVYDLGADIPTIFFNIKLSEHIVPNSEANRTFINKYTNLVHGECMELVWYRAVCTTDSETNNLVVLKLERCSSYQEI